MVTQVYVLKVSVHTPPFIPCTGTRSSLQKISEDPESGNKSRKSGLFSLMGLLGMGQGNVEKNILKPRDEDPLLEPARGHFSPRLASYCRGVAWRDKRMEANGLDWLRRAYLLAKEGNSCRLISLLSNCAEGIKESGMML